MTTKDGGRETKTLVYVAGFGRSGSTLLGRIIASTGNALDLGEVVAAPRFLDEPHHRCACGETLGTCPIWSVLPEDLKRLPHADSDRRSHLAILEAIAGMTDHPFLVDSSKTAGPHSFIRPFYLRRRLSIPLRLVHLVRDPRAVFWSVLRWRMRDGQLDRFSQGALAAKVSLSWMAANLSAELFRLLHPRTSVQVTYNDLLRGGAPRALNDILPEGSLENFVLEQGPNCHCIGGNAMRYQKTVVVKPDEAWRDEIPASLAAIVTAMSWPLMLKYGFVGNGRRSRYSSPS